MTKAHHSNMVGVVIFCRPASTEVTSEPRLSVLLRTALTISSTQTTLERWVLGLSGCGGVGATLFFYL